MKKLIATAVVAAAAYGAFAIETGVRFENLPRGTTTIDALNAAANEDHNTENYTYWSGDAGNTYSVSDFTVGEHASYAHPDYFVNTDTPTNALSVKTTFGKPLSFAVNGDGTDGNMGIYFDSLVKFTVCEEAPDTDYAGAKIALWLQEEYDEDDNIIGTNLMVKAGFLSIGENGVEVSNAVYKAGNTQINDGAFADKWHRVTIKTIADITEDADNVSVPGFVIYIDGNLTKVITIAATDQPKWDESFTYALNEIAFNLNDSGYLFPSMVQGSATEKDTLKGVQFDGTGSINELVFTETEPWFASDEEYMDPKFTLQLGEEGEPIPFKTVAAAVEHINSIQDAGAYTLKLENGITLSETLVFENANLDPLTIDFNGCIITNKGSFAAISNSVNLVLKDSRATGGIYCEGAGEAVVATDNNLSIESGNFWGDIIADAAMSVEISGGSFQQDDVSLGDGKWLKEGKKLEMVEEGWYTVFDKVSYTVTFKIDAEVYSTTNVVEGTKVADIVPAAPTKTGYDFNGWGIEANAVVTGDATFTAQWTIKTFTVTVASAGDNMTVVVTKNGEEVDYASSYTVNYGDDVSVVYAAEDGYELTGQATFTFSDINANVATTAPTAAAIKYTISYDVDGIAATTYTVADLNTTIELPTASREGYKFDGWTNETYMTAITSFEITVLGNVELYAKWTADTPAEPETPEIAPGSDSVEVDAGAGDTAEGVAAKVEVQLPAEVVVATGVDNITYQGYFTKTATLDESTGKWTVTAEIAETVEEAVAESAVEALSAAEPTVSIPRGLYYKITTMTSLEGEGAQSVKGISNGAGISVTKPGQKKGFIKVQMGTQEYK